MSFSPASIFLRRIASARAGWPISNTMSRAGPGAPPCNGPFNAPRAPDDGGDEVGAGRRDHTRSERGGIEPVVDHCVEIRFEPPNPSGNGLLAVQHVQKVCCVAQIGS